MVHTVDNVMPVCLGYRYLGMVTLGMVTLGTVTLTMELWQSIQSLFFSPTLPSFSLPLFHPLLIFVVCYFLNCSCRKLIQTSDLSLLLASLLCPHGGVCVCVLCNAISLSYATHKLRYIFIHTDFTALCSYRVNQM